MRKLLICLTIILVSGLFVGAGCDADKEAAEQAVEKVTGVEAVEIKQEASRDLAIARCQELYFQKVALAEDMSDGPCLSEKIVEDWVCDVVHEPRQAVDNETANQCVSYRNGTIGHFVELDINGELIKAQ
ncbi:hypothetical protein ACFL0Z_01545 [Patescibacteria group bacterium]